MFVSSISPALGMAAVQLPKASLGRSGASFCIMPSGVMSSPMYPRGYRTAAEPLAMRPILACDSP